MQKREVKAILFDLDGVLVNSEDAWYHTYNDMIATYGIKAISRKEFSKIFGNTVEKNAKSVINITAKDANRLAIKYFAKNRKYVTVFPKSIDILEKLSDSKLKIALITNTPKRILMHTLKHYKLKKYFKAIVTVDDVKRGKPAPDMVIKACRILKVNPKNTILIGDSKNDMAAGRRAGCISVGYGINGDYKISSLKEILGMLS